MHHRAPDGLTYPLPLPESPENAIKVGPGLHWARLPLPFKLDHVNIWLLEDGDGWTVVDTGVASERTRHHWEQLFAGPMGGRPVTRVLCTHFHPDHVGLAGWLTQRWGAEFCASLAEWLFGRALSLDTEDSGLAASLAFYRRIGLADAEIEAIAARGNAYARGVTPLPRSLRRLRAGDTLRIGDRAWTVLIGTGHTPEHVCLYAADDRILIAGDQILPRISPNISVWPSEPEADPLGDFLASLDRLRTLPEDVLVLPSHDRPFYGLHRRIDELERHHAERLADTVAACAEPRTAAEVMRTMFARELDLHQMLFAVGEALAHLNHLVVRGCLERWSDESGLLHFRAVQGAAKRIGNGEQRGRS